MKTEDVITGAWLVLMVLALTLITALIILGVEAL
jgi:hypothetical protein